MKMSWALWPYGKFIILGSSVGVDGALLGQDVGAAESEMTAQRQETDPWVAAQLERAVQFINLR